MHLDMNSYFASVEQQANPFLRGRPVGVCAYLSPGGCIIASSVEAKAKGVKTGFRVRDAKQLCPEIFLIENEPAKYRTVTENIFKILAEYTDTLEPYSIDEAFLDLTGWAEERIVRIKHPEIWKSQKLETGIQEREVQKPILEPFVINEPAAHSWIPHQVRDDNNNEARSGEEDDFYWAKVIASIIRERIKREVGEWMHCSIGISYTKFLAKFASDIAPKKGILVIRNQ